MKFEGIVKEENIIQHKISNSISNNAGFKTDIMKKNVLRNMEPEDFRCCGSQLKSTCLPWKFTRNDHKVPSNVEIIVR